jgi:hypothetical protein
MIFTSNLLLFWFIMCCEILNLIKYFLQVPHVVFIDKPVIRENRACFKAVRDSKPKMMHRTKCCHSLRPWLRNTAFK